MNRALEEAARWRARLGADDCSAADRQSFERWLAIDEMHAHAYERVESLSRQFEALNADPQFQAMAERAYTETREAAMKWSPGRRRVLWALAASILVGVGTFTLSTSGLLGRDGTLHYETKPYERHDIKLADGSLVRLDADSAFTVDLSKRVRNIDLLRGRAVFEVNHDPSRPFVVHFGGERVTALGTVFEVQRTASGTLVTLEEGTVLVASEAQAADEGQRLVPGEQISVLAGEKPASWARRSVDAPVVTGWSRGRLVFRATPLPDVLDEINRYSPKKIRLGSPVLESMPVSGSFVAGNSEMVVPALAALLPIDAIDNGSEFVLYEKH